MKIQTFSIIAGSEACNAKCPYCVSKMTPSNGMSLKQPEVNWRNFEKACTFADKSGVTTVLITGKGEPTLFPEQITEYLSRLEKHDFPFVELQTNGIILEQQREKYKKHLKEWYKKGLTTIAISAVDYNSDKNKEIFTQDKPYMDLGKLVDFLHEMKFSVRLSLVLLDGYMDNRSKLEKLIQFAKDKEIEQLTIRPVSRPGKSKNDKVACWVDKHYLKEKQLQGIKSYLEENGTHLFELPHGAIVYDVDGQNVCLTNCLTRDTDPDKLRQLIFFPDGHLRYDWEKKGAILL